MRAPNLLLYNCNLLLQLAIIALHLSCLLYHGHLRRLTLHIHRSSIILQCSILMITVAEHGLLVLVMRRAIHTRRSS